MHLLYLLLKHEKYTDFHKMILFLNKKQINFFVEIDYSNKEIKV